MTIAIEHFANELKLSPTELIQRSLIAFLERERRAVQQDIADLQDRYETRTLSELRTKIESKKIYSHPAWEDLIEWQNLEAYANQLNQLQAQIK